MSRKVSCDEPGTTTGVLGPFVAGATPWSSASRLLATTTAITAASAATSARAPYFRLRCAFLIVRSCSAQVSLSGSVCCLTISKTSLRSGMGASRSAESGPALRGEGANGRWTDAHDPCGLPRVVVVQVEQEEGGTLPGSQGEEHLANVFAQLNLVEGVVHDPERYPSAGGQP